MVTNCYSKVQLEPCTNAQKENERHHFQVASLVGRLVPSPGALP